MNANARNVKARIDARRRGLLIRPFGIDHMLFAIWNRRSFGTPLIESARATFERWQKTRNSPQDKRGIGREKIVRSAAAARVE